MWQAAVCASAPCQLPSTGSLVWHTASANGQRVWNRQPGGGSIGFGGSPVIGGSSTRGAGSIDGRDASSARVYGCCGCPKIASTGPSSTTLPRYITSTRSLI